MCTPTTLRRRLRSLFPAPMAIERNASNVVSEKSLTLRGFAEAISAGFGQPSRLHFSAFEHFAAGLSEEDAATSREHISRSHTMSIARARSGLGYEPRYSSLEAVAEAVELAPRRGSG